MLDRVPEFYIDGLGDFPLIGFFPVVLKKNRRLESCGQLRKRGFPFAQVLMNQLAARLFQNYFIPILGIES